PVQLAEVAKRRAAVVIDQNVRLRAGVKQRLLAVRRGDICDDGRDPGASRLGQFGGQIPGIEPGVEDAADAARLAPMLKKKILVAPGFELLVGRNRRMRVA